MSQSRHSKVKKKEMDSHSVHSSRSAVSRSSERRRPHTGRFSLRRIFCRTSTSPRLYQSARTSSDVESDISSGSGSQNEQSQSQVPSRVQPEPSSVSGTGTECPLCLMRLPDENFPTVMTCDHRSCRDCLRQYLKIEITESRVNITCPECVERMHPNDIRLILDDENLMLKYEEFMIRRVLVADPDVRWCPAPDCTYAVIATGCASCPRIGCERPGCNTFFCYHCKQHWHPNQTCDAARAERSGRSSSFSYSHESNTQNDIKPCPRCGAFIVKMDDGSCNHMTCAVCGAEFCWLCMKEISDLHYLSPSGCTFWGKKPWSRKKKILWQLGTLVGAPVGIGLVAGIAVPAMIIGIPVWVGRKLHAKYEHVPKHRRNAVIVGGVTASILVSPIIAGLAVGIGVPILLAYVYGVVPISLCRSGGCGVTTSGSGGVRFDFDDDNEVTVGVSGPYADTHSVETTSHHGHVNNPSIGPSIGELSMGMTNSLSASGSHMERVGVIHESDRESASHRAIAGASLNGSLCGSTTAAYGYQNKLEVQVDVSGGQATTNKRASLSSESANFSIGEKSTTVSFGDDASTKALAGSLAGNRAGDNNSTIMEVQVDVSSNRAKFYSTEAGSEVSDMAKGSGSPTSSRSVNFAGEETLQPAQRNSSRKYKRRSVSVGDKIHEHSDKPVGDLSIKSLTGDPEPAVSCLKKTNLQVTHDYQCRSSSPSYCASLDNVLSSQEEGLCSGMTEVENDHPLGVPIQPLPRNPSVLSDSSVETGATLCNLGGRDTRSKSVSSHSAAVKEKEFLKLKP